MRNQLAQGTTIDTSRPSWDAWTICGLEAGPVWNSFESFRTKSESSIEFLAKNSVAMLRTKTSTFRILHEEDFQRLVGTAAENRRIQDGLKVVASAVRVALKHPDNEHLNLILESVSVIAGTPELPRQAGHDLYQFVPTTDVDQCDDFDPATEQIVRP